MIITDNDISMVQAALEKAQQAGALMARATLNRSREELVATLDGKVDKITSCADSSLSLALFVDGRYGTFSTNKLDGQALDAFISRSVDIVRMMAADPCRKLPARERQCRTAITGNECGTADPEWNGSSPESRREAALAASVHNSASPDMNGCRMVSEEGEYSEACYDQYVADTQGLSCRHTETSFDYGVEVTLEDKHGDKYNAYHWHSAPFRKDLDAGNCGAVAIAKAAAQVGSAPVKSGKYNCVIDSEVASKVVSPILNALAGYSIQQNNSFLLGSLGKTVFPEGLTIMDMPHIKGQTGSRLFDSEGVATVEGPVIDHGRVCKYFLNTYMAGKLDMEPTVEEAARPRVMPWPRSGMTRDDIMNLCGEGILITDFNGGNCNMATGDFSYGIEGFRVRSGRIAEPVSGMLVTGNFISLWQGLIAAGDDARVCMSKLIPTLAFSNVDFNG